MELDSSDTVRWLRHRFRLGRREADRLHDLAHALPHWPGTQAALAAGTVSAEQAAVMTHALDELPPTTGIDGLLDPGATAAVRAALEGRAEPHRTDDGVRDERTKAQRMADALHELALAALADTDAVVRDADPTLDLQPELAADSDPDHGAGADAVAGSPRGTSADRAAATPRIAPAQVSLIVRWETLQALAQPQPPACSTTAYP